MELEDVSLGPNENCIPKVKQPRIPIIPGGESEKGDTGFPPDFNLVSPFYLALFVLYESTLRCCRQQHAAAADRHECK